MCREKEMKEKNADPVFRYQMMERGWMNKTDFQKFACLGYKKANEAFKQMKSEIKKEGYEMIEDNVILTKRAIAFCGLSKQEIIRAYNAAKDL